MAMFLRFSLILIILMGIAAGLPKLAYLPNEADFGALLGLSEPIIRGFGAAQILGGVFAWFPAYRALGLAILLFTFAGSVVLLLTLGQVTFALISLLPMLLAGFLFFREWRRAGRD